MAVDPDDPAHDDLHAALSPGRRWLLRSRSVLGVMVALALVVPLGAGLVQTFVFNRAGDRVAEELDGEDLDAALAEAVLLVGGTTCRAAGAVSGTAFALRVGDRDLLVTNRHVVDDLRSVGLRTLRGDPGPRVAAWRLSRSADLAVLQLEEGADMPPALVLAAGSAQAGDRVRTVGFPSGLPFTAAGDVAAVTGRFMELDVRVDPGASGSPVLDTTGHVVAQVVARTEEGRGVATTAGTLRGALDDLAASRSDCPTVAPDAAN